MFCIILSAARDDWPSARYIKHTTSSGFQFHLCAVETKKKRDGPFWELKVDRRAPALRRQMEHEQRGIILQLVQTSARNENSEVTTDVKDKMSPAAVLTCLINKLSHSTLPYILSQPIITQWPGILYTVYIIDVNELKGSKGFGVRGGDLCDLRVKYDTSFIHVMPGPLFMCDWKVEPDKNSGTR